MAAGPGAGGLLGGQAALEALEKAVGDFARSYPSTAPTILARPVLEHFRDVIRLLDGPLPVASRQRLAVVAGHLAGLAGSLAFDLRDEANALAYFKVAVQAADDAGSPDLAAWALATRSLIPTYTGDPAAALRLLQEAQDRAQAYVQDRAVEEACAAVVAALAIRHENRVGPILRRAREVRASLEPWRDERPVKELDEQLRPLLSA